MSNELFTADSQPEIPIVKTGLPAIDAIIGGGLPKGKIAEVYGLQGTGKTTMCMQIASNAQSQGLRVVWIDLENAWDRQYAENLNVDLKKLLMMKPSYGEEAFEGIESILREETADFIIVDSVPALAPRAELEAEIGKPTMGSQARLMSQGLRKLIPLLENSGVVLIFINQLRVNIMGGQYDPYTRPGGMSLKFYERTALELKNRGGIKKGEAMIGKTVGVRSVKSYSTAPMKKAELRLIFGEGFSDEADTLAVAIELGIITKKGITFFYGETKLGAGLEKARLHLKTYPQVLEEIKSKI